MASSNRLGSSLRGRRWASTSIEMRPARSSTFRCLEMAGWLISNGSASSVTVADPVASRARMARRVGSARAAKVRSRRSEACITLSFYKVAVIYNGTKGLSRLSPGLNRLFEQLQDGTQVERVTEVWINAFQRRQTPGSSPMQLE